MTVPDIFVPCRQQPVNVNSARFPSLAVTCGRRRSQWPRDRRHEMSSPVETLGLWARIPLEAWKSVRVYSVIVVSYLASGLTTGLIARRMDPTDCP
jgi:hypothetical protein